MDTGGNMDIDTDTDSGHGYKHGFEDMDTGMDILWAQNPEKKHSAENRTKIQIEIAVSAVIFLQWVGICIEIVHRNFRDPK